MPPRRRVTLTENKRVEIVYDRGGLGIANRLPCHAVLIARLQHAIRSGSTERPLATWMVTKDRMMLRIGGTGHRFPPPWH
jgi:hypothetical protein